MNSAYKNVKFWMNVAAVRQLVSMAIPDMKIIWQVAKYLLIVNVVIC